MINGKVGWQLFSSDGILPLEAIKFCMDSWKGWYDEMFCWINKDGKNQEVRDLIEERSTGMLITPAGKGRHHFIRETPLNIAKSMTKIRYAMKYPKPFYLMQFDDDEAIPAHPDFPKYFNEWLSSDSQAMLMNFMFFWEDFETIRVDKSGTTLRHAFFFKYHKDFSWIPYAGAGLPKNIKNTWKCPYPVRHFSKWQPAHRLKRIIQKKPNLRKVDDKDRPAKWKHHPERAILRKFDPLITSKNLFNWRKMCKRGKIPDGCWEYVRPE